jgi:hypothetical protein
MSPLIVYPVRLQLPSGQSINGHTLMPGTAGPSDETPIPGHICEQCLDAPALRY